MKITEEMIAALLRASPISRYEFFVKKCADWELLWGLYCNADAKPGKPGWAMMADHDGNRFFPVWPAKEFARLRAIGVLAGYEPRSISIHEFLNVVIPELREEGTGITVFPTPTQSGVVPSMERLIRDLSNELDKYE